MTSSCFGCVVGNLVPRALNFFHLQLKNCLGFVSGFVGVIFVLDLVRKLIPIKWRACECLRCRDNTCHYFCEAVIF